MTAEVQKIKEWISKEQDGLMDAQGNFGYPEHEGAYHILCNLDAFIDSLQEEPVSDECIYNRTLEERQRSCKFCSAACQVRIKEEPVSENLEDAAFDYAEACKYEGGEKLLCVEHFKAGAKWKEKQMMAKAVDGDITFDYYGDGDKTYGCIAHNSFCLEDFGLKDRDKVKVIVIKMNRL